MNLLHFSDAIHNELMLVVIIRTSYNTTPRHTIINSSLFTLICRSGSEEEMTLLKSLLQNVSDLIADIKKKHQEEKQSEEDAANKVIEHRNKALETLRNSKCNITNIKYDRPFVLFML